MRLFIQSLLTQCGLVLRKDYIVTDNHLRIRHAKQLTGKLLVTLKENFPMFNFYWETPRMLVWF